MALNDTKKNSATELTGDSNSAATEHTEEPQLAELLSQEAGLTGDIKLKVIRNQIIDYSYKYEGCRVSSQKIQIILQSKTADQYCLGVAKLQKKKQS